MKIEDKYPPLTEEEREEERRKLEAYEEYLEQRRGGRGIGGVWGGE